MAEIRPVWARRKKWILAALVFLLGASCVGFDNGDVWFMDVHAQDMLENGFGGNVGRFTAHDGLTAPHQKWAMCLLVHAFMQLGRVAGIGEYEAMFAASALFCGMFALILYLVSVRPGRELLSASLTAFFTFFLSVSGISVILSFRPHVVAACLCMIESRLLERQYHDPDRKPLPTWSLLAVLSLCSLACMWFHSTMWPLCLIPVLPFLGEAVLRRLRKKSVPDGLVKTCVLAFPAMILAGCLNPLGLGQFAYMKVTAMAGSSGKYSFVGEMRPFFTARFDFYVIFWILACALAAFVLARSKAPARDWLFFLGSAAMAAVSIRLMIYFYAMVLPIVIRRLPDLVPERLLKKSGALVLAASALLIVSFVPLRPEFREVTRKEYDTFQRSAAAMKQDLGEHPRVFAIHTHVASMLLWDGFLPAFDTRAEIYDGDLNGGYDVLANVNFVYEKMVDDEEVPWDYIKTDIFEKYDLDAMVFHVNYLPGALIEGIQSDEDELRTFVVDDAYVICERKSSIKTQ